MTYEERIISHTKACGEHDENQVDVLRHFENLEGVDAFCRRFQLAWEHAPHNRIRFLLLQQNKNFTNYAS
jgi:hypothetical protein